MTTEQQTIHSNTPLLAWTNSGSTLSVHLAGSLSMSRRSGKNRGRASSQTSNRTEPSSSDEDSDDSTGNSHGNKKYSQPVVIYRTSLHNTIFDVFRSRSGWEETDSDTDWDINWADVGWIRDYFDHVHMDDHQRVNHFRNHYELTRKDLMVKNIKRFRKDMEKENNPIVCDAQSS